MTGIINICYLLWVHPLVNINVILTGQYYGNVAVIPTDPIIYLTSRRASLSASAELLAVYISVRRLYPGGLHVPRPTSSNS